MITRKSNEKIFNNNFTLEGLRSINEQLISSNFFEANHTINLNDDKFYKEDLQNFIEEELSMIYKTPEVEEKFNDAKKVMEKKAP